VLIDWVMRIVTWKRASREVRASSARLGLGAAVKTHQAALKDGEKARGVLALARVERSLVQGLCKVWPLEEEDGVGNVEREDVPLRRQPQIMLVCRGRGLDRLFRRAADRDQGLPRGPAPPVEREILLEVKAVSDGKPTVSPSGGLASEASCTNMVCQRRVTAP
jgi:hypothetical protein